MAKTACVCIGTDPEIVMIGALTGVHAWLGDGNLCEKYSCNAKIGNWLCSRRKGHSGPHVACNSHGFDNDPLDKHNLTNAHFAVEEGK